MHPAYFETRFRTQEPVPRWPREFVIVTAYATTGDLWPHQRNVDANRKLEAELREGRQWHHPVTGYAPATGHEEPGWAVELGVAVGTGLGRRHLQDAIFHVHGDLLRVVPCESGARQPAFVGSFRQRLDNADGLPTAICPSRGLGIVSS
jgi:hypothetical protein